MRYVIPYIFPIGQVSRWADCYWALSEELTARFLEHSPRSRSRPRWRVAERPQPGPSSARSAVHSGASHLGANPGPRPSSKRLPANNNSGLDTIRYDTIRCNMIRYDMQTTIPASIRYDMIGHDMRTLLLFKNKTLLCNKTLLLFIDEALFLFRKKTWTLFKHNT